MDYQSDYLRNCSGTALLELNACISEIDSLMPPVSRFGGGNRRQKKQGIIEKLKAFFERFFGLGGGGWRKPAQDGGEPFEPPMAAEEQKPYGK